MVQSFTDLRELGAASLEEGADVAAHGIHVLTEELGQGIANLGQGVAGGVGAYMDRAAPYLLAVGVGGLLLAAGGGYLLLTGGGQALLKGAGATLVGTGKLAASVA